MEDVVAGNAIERWIRIGVGFFCLGVWAVIGVIYWIPLLARSCGAYSAAVIMAIIGGRPANKKAARMLDVAANFYSKGFRDIRESVFGARPPDGTDETDQPSIFASWDEFFRVLTVVATESAIALLFWVAIVLLLVHIF